MSVLGHLFPMTNLVLQLLTSNFRYLNSMWIFSFNSGLFYIVAASDLHHSFYWIRHFLVPEERGVV